MKWYTPPCIQSDIRPHISLDSQQGQDISSLVHIAQTGSEAQPTSDPVGYRGLFSGGKAAGA
jgi:hypothetical protein